MDNKKAVYAIASIAVLLLGFYSAFYPQRAYAQTFQVVSGLAYPVKALHYDSQADSIIVLSAQFTGGQKTFLYEIDRSTKSLIGTHNITKIITDGGGGGAQDLWCGLTDCYITVGSGGVAPRLVRIGMVDLPPNIFRLENLTGSYTHSVTATSNTGFGHLTGRDSVSGGFGSVTVWVDACVDSACNSNQIQIIDGISMLLSGTLPSTSSGVQVKVHELYWSGIAGADDNDLVTVAGGINNASANNELTIYNLATLTTKCSIAVPNIPLSVKPLYVGAGNANNKVFVSAGAGKLFVYNDNCSLLQTVSASQTGIPQDLRFVDVASGRVFMQGNGSNAIISQMLLNSTGHVQTGNKTLYFPLPSASQTNFDSTFTTITLQNLLLFQGNGQLWFPYTGTDKKVGILTYDAIGGGEGGEFCDDPANANILICRLGGDGTLGSAGAFVIGNTTQGTGVLGISCSIGIVDCVSDPNPQTNGLGLLIFIASIFVVIGMFFAGLGANASFQLPVFIWVIIVVALSAFFTITGLIDPVFLILSIVAVIALASPKIIGLIQNRGGGFGGGSTE